MRNGHAEIKALEESLKVIGEKIAPHCLVLIETTVPPGTTEYVAYPILKKAFEARGLGKGRTSEVGDRKSEEKPEAVGDISDIEPLASDLGLHVSDLRPQASDFGPPDSDPEPPIADLGPLTSDLGLRVSDLQPRTSGAAEPLLAHSYERVMPGRHYVASIRDFWRVCSGVNAEARDKVVRFLGNVLNVEKFPLTVLDRPIESETAKIVENSYRATILAFLDEWSRFSERNGVDLIKVIEAIKVRPTHDNMIFPGPGIGGYCLPKDGGLGVWAYNTLMGFEDDIFKITPLAIDINDTRSLHVAQLVRDALRNMGRIVAASKVAVLGASYRQDVGDTRYSGSEIIVRKIAEMGGDVVVHDPYVKHWWEFEKQESYPAPGKSWARFFRNQQHLSDLKMAEDLASALAGVDAVVLAVPHQSYKTLMPDQVVAMVGGSAAIVDCFGLLDDDQIRRYFELGWEVKGLGRGHVQRIKKQVKNGK